MMGQWVKSRPKDFLPSLGLHLQVSPRKNADANQSWWGWSSGKLSPALSEFGSQEVDWQPHSGPLAISGKTPGTSLSRIIHQPKILTRNLSLTWGRGGWGGGCRTRSELSVGTQTFLPASWEVLCLKSQPHFGAKPWWFTCHLWEEHGPVSSQHGLFIPEGATMSSWFSQPSLTNLQICSVWRKAF